MRGGPHPVRQGHPAALVRLAARRAWPLATGAGVTVAVVDTGVAPSNAHFPDGVVLPGRSFVGGSARTDARLHGTAVAGIVAARPLGARSGVKGLAPGARILPVKVVPDEQRPRRARRRRRHPGGGHPVGRRPGPRSSTSR